MTVLSAAQPTLIGRLWPQTAGNSMARAAALILIGSALMAIAAHIQVPFWPVKLSMQSFVAIVIGMAYGARLGGATILAYIAEGAVGLPVFQSGAGIAYMASRHESVGSVRLLRTYGDHAARIDVSRRNGLRSTPSVGVQM